MAGRFTIEGEDSQEPVGRVLPSRNRFEIVNDALPTPAPQPVNQPAHARLLNPAILNQQTDFEHGEPASPLTRYVDRSILGRGTATEYDVNAPSRTLTGPGLQGAVNMANAPRRPQPLPTQQFTDIPQAQMAATQAVRPTRGALTLAHNALMESTQQIAEAQRVTTPQPISTLKQRPIPFLPTGEEFAGMGEQVLHQASNLATMAMATPNVIGNTLGELVTALVEERKPSLDNISGNIQGAMGATTYKPVTESGQRQVEAASRIMGGIPAAVDAIDDATGETFKKNFPNAYAATQVAGEFAPWVIGGTMLHGAGQVKASPKLYAEQADYDRFMQTYSAATGVRDVSSEFEATAKEYTDAVKNGDTMKAAALEGKVTDLHKQNQAYQETVGAFSAKFSQQAPTKIQINKAIEAMRKKMADDSLPDPIDAEKSTESAAKELSSPQKALENRFTIEDEKPAETPSRKEELKAKIKAGRESAPSLSQEVETVDSRSDAAIPEAQKPEEKAGGAEGEGVSLQPAVKLPDGKIVSGELESRHDDILKSEGVEPGTGNIERGFVKDGEFLTRGEAMADVAETSPEVHKELVDAGVSELHSADLETAVKKVRKTRIKKDAVSDVQAADEVGRPDVGLSGVQDQSTGVKRTFEPKEISSASLPEDTAKLLPSKAEKGQYYHATHEAVQKHVDDHGDGFLYRVTNIRGIDAGMDKGLPDYKHQFGDTSVKTHSFTTSLADAKEILANQEEGSKVVVYKIKPSDLHGEFTVQIPSTRGTDNALHIQSPVPAQLEKTEVVYRNGEWLNKEVSSDVKRDDGRPEGTGVDQGGTGGQETDVRHDQAPGRAGSESPTEIKHPFADVTREDFLGTPKITKNSNASDLLPKALSSYKDSPPTQFKGKYQIRMNEDGAAVYDGDKVIASYNFGDTLVVAPKYRRLGIGEELVYQYRMAHPDKTPAKERTKSSQALQEKVWDRIETERSKKVESPTEPVTIQSAEQPKGYTLPAEFTAESQRDLFKSLRSGEPIEVDTIKQAYKSLLDNKDTILAELSKQTKDVLLKQMGGMDAYRYKNEKKDQVVKALFRNMVTDFAYLDGSDSITTGMYDKMSDVVQKKVDALTPEKLQTYRDKIAAQTEESKARVEQAIKAIKNPETLEDFRTLLQAKKDTGKTFAEARMSMTPEQREKYDELAATDTRTRRKDQKNERKTEARAAGPATSGDVIETKHTKTGEPLFVVRAAERVEREIYNQWNATAKRLGGYYSSFRGNGAVPGFQFKDRTSADAFKKFLGGDVSEAKEKLQERRDAFIDDRSQSATERLNEMAATLGERAQESLGRDRKANTAKRAGDAARAEGQARREIATAETMRNIAKKIEDGTAKFLDQVRTKAQVEMLDSFIKTGHDKAAREDSQGQYGEYEKMSGRPLSKTDADQVEFPSYTAFRSDLARLGRELEEIDGTKKLGAQLSKVANDVTAAYLEFAEKNLHKVSTFGKKNSSTGEVTGYATFGTRDAALEAIARSGYKGKATVVSFKKGEHLVVMGPEMAKEAGLWEGDNDKRISLTPEFAEQILAKNKTVGRRNRISVPWTFDSAYEKKTRLASMGIETPSELRAALREYVDVKQAPKQADKIKELERAMVGRKNDGMDFFPTPAKSAQEMIESADIQEGMSILEPSAGMGHIADQIREAGHEPDVVEMSSDRRELLEAKGYKVAGRDFMDITGKYDRIIMNPPFSDRRDAQHVQHAFTLLNPGGRVVAIMGEGVFFGQDKKAVAFREWLDEVGGTSEKLEAGTFLDTSLPVNTGVNARMVVIDAPGEYTPRTETEPVKEASGVPAFDTKKERALQEETRATEKQLQAMRDKYSKDGRSPMIPPGIRAEQMKNIEKLADQLGAKQEELAKMYEDARATEETEAPAWHTEIPAEGLPIEPTDKDTKFGNGYMPLMTRLVDDALAAVKPNQWNGGDRFYAMVLPATEGVNGRLRLVPGDQKPQGWEFVSQEPLAIGAMTKDNLRAKLIEGLRRSPVIGETPESAAGVDDLKGFKYTYDKGDFTLERGNLIVKATSQGGGEYQASWGSATSSPRLSKQGAIDWADNLRAESERTEPLRMDGTTRPEKAKKEPLPGFAAMPEATQNKFNTAWDGRDIPKMQEYLGLDNKNLRAEFEHRTGEKLPKTVKGTDATVEEYFTRANLDDVLASDGGDGLPTRAEIQAAFESEVAFSPEQAIKVAADDVYSLRISDVYRVLDEAGQDHRQEVADYIKKNHPGNQAMLDMVRNSLKDLTKEEAYVPEIPSEYTIAAQRPGMTKDDLKTVADVVQAFKDGKITYGKDERNQRRYDQDGTDYEKLDKGLSDIPTNAKITVAKDKVTITAKGEPLTEEQKAHNIEEAKLMTDKAEEWRKKAADLKEHGYAEGEFAKKANPNNVDEASYLKHEINLFERKADQLAVEANDFLKTKSNDIKHVFYFEGDRYKQAVDAGGEMVNKRGTRIGDKNTVEIRDRMKQMAAAYPSFAKDPTFVADGKGWVHYNGKNESGKPVQFNLAEGLFTGAAGKELQNGDTVRLSPGYLENKTDEVYLIPKGGEGKVFYFSPTGEPNEQSKIKTDSGETPSPSGRAPEAGRDTQGRNVETIEDIKNHISDAFVRFGENDVVPVIYPTDKVISDIAALFGKKAVSFGVPAYVRPVDGFFMTSHPEYIFLDRRAKDAHLVILGHELNHALKADYPDLYKEIQRLELSEEAMQQNREASTKSYGREMSEEEVQDEAYGNYIAAKFTESKFWDDLAKKSPSLFEKMVAMAKALFQKVLDYFGKSDTSKYFKDIRKADNVITDVMAKYAERQGKSRNAIFGDEIKRMSSVWDILKDERGAVGDLRGEELRKYHETLDLADKAVDSEDYAAADRLIFEASEMAERAQPQEVTDGQHNIDVVDIAINSPTDTIETGEKPLRTTSTKNAVVEAESGPQERVPFTREGLVQMGKDKIDNNPLFDVRQRAIEIVNNPQGAVSIEDYSALFYDRMRIQNEYEEIRTIQREAIESGDKRALVDARTHIARLEDATRANDQATTNIGTWMFSATGHLRQAYVTENYNYLWLNTRAEAITGKSLVPELKKELETAAQRISDLEKAYQAEVKRRIEAESNKAIQRIINDEVSAPKRATKRDVVKGDRKKEFDALGSRLRAVLSPYKLNFGFDPEAIAILADMARIRIADGITDARAIVNDIYEELKGEYAFEKRDIQDALSGYGKQFQMSSDEIDVTMREIKRELKLYSALEDAEKGLVPLKSGIEHDKQSEKVRELRQQVNQSMKAHGIDQKHADPERQWQTQLDSVKTNLKNQIADLNRQIQAGKREPVKKTGVKYDTEALTLKEKRDTLKDILETIDAKPGLSAQRRVEIAMQSVERSIENYTRKIATKDFGTTQKPKSPETPELIKQRAVRDSLKQTYEQMKKDSLPPKVPKTQDELDDIRRKAYRTRLEKQIATYQEMKDTGNFTKTPRRKTPLFAEEERLLAQKNKAKEEVEGIMRRLEEENKPTLYKAIDWAMKGLRFSILSGSSVLWKIGAASVVGRPLQTVSEEAMGSLLRFIPPMRVIMDKAPREGNGMSIRAEGQAFVQWFKKEQYRNFWDRLKQGKDSIQLRYGNKNSEYNLSKWGTTTREHVTYILDSPGRAHAALKSIAYTQEYHRSLQYRTEYAIRNKWDLLDEKVLMGIHVGAEQDANRVQFMGDSFINNAYRQFSGQLRGLGPAGYAGAAILKANMPITKVPSNVVGELLSFIPPIGAGKTLAQVAKGYMAEGKKDKAMEYFTWSAYKQAVEHLTEEEAEYATRAMKKAGVGTVIAIMLATGFLAYQNFGGFYQPGEKRKSGALKADEIRIGGVNYPAVLFHMPIFDAAQSYVTMMMVADMIDQTDDKKGKKDKNYTRHTKLEKLSEGSQAATMGILEKWPYYRSPAEVARAVERKKFGEYLEQKAESFLVLPEIKKAAKRQDKYGETVVPRKGILADIPGLRKDQPIDMKKIKKMQVDQLADIMENAPSKVTDEIFPEFRKKFRNAKDLSSDKRERYLEILRSNR